MARFLKPAASGLFNHSLRRLLYSTTMTYEEFEAHRRRGSFIVDVREPKELEQLGEVPGAVNIPLGYVEKAFAMEKAEFKAIIGATKPEQEDTVVFLCMKGIRARTAKEAIEAKFGFKNSTYYPGSFAEWTSKQQG